MKWWMYELIYRYPFIPIPWETGPREGLVNLVESGRAKPCRAIDLGCGTASNVVYLAQHGFDVTGVDFASSAITKARQKAEAAGLKAEFVVDDLTNLYNVTGSFDFLVDAGVLDVLQIKFRDHYVQNLLPLTHPGSRFFLYGWEWTLSPWEQLLLQRLSLFGAILEPGEIEQCFGAYFEIERIYHETNPRSGLIAILSGKKKATGYAVYLMTRNATKPL